VFLSICAALALQSFQTGSQRAQDLLYHQGRVREETGRYVIAIQGEIGILWCMLSTFIDDDDTGRSGTDLNVLSAS